MGCRKLRSSLLHHLCLHVRRMVPTAAELSTMLFAWPNELPIDQWRCSARQHQGKRRYLPWTKGPHSEFLQRILPSRNCESEIRMRLNILNVIILWDRVFERYCIYYPSGAYVTAETFDNALNYIKHFPQLREVPVNSKPGQRILKAIGGQTHPTACGARFSDTPQTSLQRQRLPSPAKRWCHGQPG